MKKNYLLKGALGLVMALVCATTWAQEPFLTVEPTGTYPYEVEKSADVFAKEELTILLDVTMPASGEGVLISASDVTVDGTQATNNTSTYVAYGVSGKKFRCYASSANKMWYTGGSENLKSERRQYIAISMSKESQARKIYMRTKDCSYNFGYQDFCHFSDNTNASIFIGGGKTNAGNKLVFGGTIHSVEFYEGIYTAEALLAHKTVTDEARATVLEDVETLLDYTGVGYPSETPRTTLNSAVDYFNSYTTNYDNEVAALQTAMVTYKSSTDVQMPEDGKAYTITFRPVNKEIGTYRFLNYSNGTLATEVVGETMPATATFVCHLLDATTNKYIFVPASIGGYLAHRAVSTAYAENVNDVVVAPLMGVTSYITDTSVDNLFGLVSMTIQSRSASDATDGTLTSKEGTANLDNTSAPILRAQNNGTFTSALILEEVPYANTVAMKSDGADAYATLYLPFAADVPDGVVAYTGATNADNTALTLTAVEGTLPAGEAVVLKAEGKTEGFDAVFVPSIEAPTKSETNVLVGYAEDTEAPAGTVFALGNVDGVGFYNYTGATLPAYKAFVVLQDAATNALKFNFGEATAIESVQTQLGVDAPIYDLSGRRVVNAAKGGLYIQNGRKFIVK